MHWEKNENLGGVFCPNCHKWFSVPYHYCPNCKLNMSLETEAESEWEYDSFYGRWRCKKCHWFSFNENELQKPNYDYCPVCKTKMKGE